MTATSKTSLDAAVPAGKSAPILAFAGDGETLECVDYTGAPVDADYADRYMMALMWALKQGNNVGYVEFWDRMETFIANEFPGDLGLFQHVRDLHDIHPINADGAPVCAAGDPAGPG